MKQTRKCGYEILAFFLGVALGTMILYLYTVNPEDLNTRGTILFGILFDVIALYFVMRKLWRTKWRYRVMPSVQKILDKLARVFKIFRQKLGLPEREDQTVLGGKSKIYFDSKPINTQTKKAKKPSAWKNLHTDKERLGYLYRRMIDSTIHQGVPVFSSETPSEICEKKDYRDVENQIFDLYVANRYKDDVELDSDMLDDLKKEMKNAKG